MSMTAKLVFAKRQTGVGLIELVIAIVIIGIIGSGFMSALSMLVGNSVDPMLQQQAVAIAEAYLEEIMLQSYDDPDATESGEERDTFDDVDDYHIADCSVASAVVVKDHYGVAQPDLAAYSVCVKVQDTTLQTVPAKQITVTVIPPAGNSAILSVFRTNF